MTLMPLPTQNILRIFWAVCHFTGWNVQIIYSIRFVPRTLSRRSSATFGSAPDLRVPSWFFKNLRTFGPSGWLRASRSFGFIRRPSAALFDLWSVGQPPGTSDCRYLRLHPKTFGRITWPSVGRSTSGHRRLPVPSAPVLWSWATSGSWGDDPQQQVGQRVK